MHFSGNPFDYVVAFLSGVVVSFTPCVYPVLPITAGIIGGLNTKGTKIMGLWLSLIYVLGMAVTYSLLAVVAALTRSVFGQWQNQPAVYFLISAFLLFFALVMLDVIPLPAWGADVQVKIKPRNLWTVGLLGASAGLVVGPCSTPVLGTLLLYTSSLQNIFRAMSLLFVFAYGVGTSLILVGTFSGFLARLPKSGQWLLRVKQFCALVLLVIAGIYLVKAGKAIF